MKVIVTPYQAQWQALFNAEKALIEPILGANAVAIHHIGSTSVEGLAAKPVIDFLLEVKSLSQLDAQSARFTALGYEVMGELGITGRRYFRKGRESRTHHVHGFEQGDPHIDRHLAFRDYLRTHPDVCAQYQTLKFELAANHKDDIDAYCAGKDSFIKQHEQLALAWRFALAAKR